MLRFLDGLASAGDVRQPAARLVLETLPQQRTECGWGFRRQRLPIGVAFQDGRYGVRQGLALKGALACEQLVQQASEGPDVGPLVDVFPSRLFRAHVPRRTYNMAAEGRYSRDFRSLRKILVPFRPPDHISHAAHLPLPHTFLPLAPTPT